MRVRRCHSIELARYYQHLDNVERRRKEAEKNKKRGFLARLVGLK